MSFDDTRDVLLEERVAQLQEISQRRKDMLQEMFHLLRLRDGVGIGLELKLDVDEDEPLHKFLEAFDLIKNPEMGSVLNFVIPEHPPSRSLSPSYQEISNELVSNDVSVHSVSKDEEELVYPELEDNQEAFQDVAEPLLLEPPIVTEGGFKDEQGKSPKYLDQDYQLVKENEDNDFMDVDEDQTRSESWVKVNEENRIEDDAEADVQDTGKVSIEEETHHDDSVMTENVQSSGRPSSPIYVPDDEDHDELDIISLSSSDVVSIPSPHNRRVTRQSARRTIHSESEEDSENEIEEVQREHKSSSVKHEETENELPKEQEEEIRPEIFRLQTFSPAATPPPATPPSLSPRLIQQYPVLSPRNEKQALPRFIELPPARVDILADYKFVDQPPPTPPTVILHSPGPPLQRILKSVQIPIPPLSALPPEFNKKGKFKQRKREKDKDKSGSESGKKDDLVPLGLAKWFATLRVNPVHKRVSRATKCLSTRDWNTAMMELELVRAFERIETLKDEGRWSFRQPKKQRGMGGLTKTHWDYLMDEMKWLQVDFREERKWKLAVAYELAIAVLEWHQVGSTEERIKLGICTLWRRPPNDVDQEMPMDIDGQLDGVDQFYDYDNNARNDVERDTRNNVLEDEDGFPSEEMGISDDPLNPENLINDELDSQIQSTAKMVDFVAPKIEDIDNSAVLRGMVGEEISNSMDIDSHPQDDIVVEEIHQNTRGPAGLIDSSSNPMFGDQSQPDSSKVKDEAISSGNLLIDKKSKVIEQLQVLREPIINLPETAFSIDLDLRAFHDPSNSSEPDEIPEPDLSLIFPDMQPYSLLDLSALDTSDTKRKPERKQDKDDPLKRTEETTYNKLYPANKFMHMKPILVSALQPAQKWHDGAWHSLDESPIIADLDSFPSLPGEDSMSSLFDNRRQLAMLQPHAFLQVPHKNHKRTEVPWSPAEDSLLKQLVDRYFSNWKLIADSFNSSRINVSNDKRSPTECLERWGQRWSSAARLANANGNADPSGASPSLAENTPPPTSSTPSHGVSMTTRGTKRMASSAQVNTNNNLAVSATSNTTESRKRRRHALIHEAMRKVGKKREAMAKNANKPSGRIHDTHQPFQNKVKYTPQDLSRLKAETDSQELVAQQQRRQDELRRQVAKEQVRLHMQPQQSQQSQPGNVLPMQGIPQIRSSQVNISQHQQQRQAATNAALQTSIPGNPLPTHLLLQAQQARAYAQLQAAQAQAQVQAQQAQAQAQGHAQAQAQNQSPQGPIPARLSPSFSNHVPNSPGMQVTSPPRPNTMQSQGSNSPRPPSAQRNVSMIGAPSMTGPSTHVSIPVNAMARQNTNLPAYFPATSGQFTQEQIAQMIRLQMLTQQQAQQNQMNSNMPIPQNIPNHPMNNSPYPLHNNNGA